VESTTATRRAERPAALEAAAGTSLGPWLLVGLLLAGGYAAFANGAVSLPQESYLQIAIALGIVVTGAGLGAGSLRAGRVPYAWAGVGLLAGFALWSGLSMLWSATPGDTWIASNRALAYAAVAAIALVAASSSRDAPSLVAIGFAAVSMLVALYGLGGKIVPEISILGFSLDPGDAFSRLREPLGYWNAIGLLSVMTTPFCIWLAAARTPARGVRIGALLILATLLLTAALTYSRGALLAYAAVVAVMVGFGSAHSFMVASTSTETCALSVLRTKRSER